MRCAVVGAGAWGTALGTLLCRGGHDVRIWALESDVVESINEKNENPRFLNGIPLDRGLHADFSVARVVEDSELVLFAPPSFALREVARAAHAAVGEDALVVVATKGIEPKTLSLMSEILEEELDSKRVVALSGPSFATEVATGMPTAVVVAAHDIDDAREAQQVFAGDTFRTYAHDDVIGVELGGALKNVMAVATGIADGLGLGFNARAALITRGLAEMTRLGVALGARAETFAGLAGLGDLVLTCTGALSRNRALGVELAEGRTLEEIMRGRDTVAEGVTTTRSALALAQREGIEMPIVEAVRAILFGGRAPRDAMAVLMARELRAEAD